MVEKHQNNRIKRHIRVRSKIEGSSERPRLAVFRSSAHIYAQLIDDSKGRTIASSNDLDVKEAVAKIDRSKLVGTKLAQAALKAKVKKVSFDRGGFAYHGRVKALADAAREAGLEF